MCTGQIWRCTDVGSRTILAIEIKPDQDENWYNGPPYAVEEQVFDEIEIRSCHRNIEEAAREAMETLDFHPGYSSEVVKKMMNHKNTTFFLDHSERYPHERLLRFDRVDEQGEILHPYGAKQHGDEWRILVYLPYAKEFSNISESKFIRLKSATLEDYRRRKDD